MSASDTPTSTPTPAPAPAKATGPASYFPSIEKKYGQPIEHWLDLARARIAGGEAHMAVVAWLKEQHGLGHGHANAVVAHVRAQAS